MAAQDQSDPHILVADANALCSAGLVSMIRHSISNVTISVASTIGCVTEQFCDDRPPSLILLDGRLQGLGGARGIRGLSAAFPSPCIILMAKPLDTDWIKGIAIETGVRDCLTGNEPDSVLEAMIRAGLDGHSDGQRLGTAINPVAPGRDNPRLRSLTGRQRSIVQMLASGMSNRQIGSLLGICEGTVKAHLLSAYRKMGVRNRVEAVARVHGQQAQSSLPHFSPRVEARA